MKDVKTFRMTSSVSGKAGPETLEGDYETVAVRSSRNPSEFNMEITNKRSGTVIYQVNGVQYMQIMGKWRELPEDETITVTDFQDVLEMVSGARLRSEDDDSWTLAFQGDQKTLAKFIVGEEEEPDVMTKEFLKTVKIGGTMKIAKKTYHLQESKFKISASVAMMGMDVKMSMVFSDINADLVVPLPPEEQSTT